jgi:hypothetical protein
MRLNITQVACAAALAGLALYGYGIVVGNAVLIVAGLVICLPATVVAVRTGI